MDKGREAAIETPRSPDVEIPAMKKETHRPQSLEVPPTLELRKHGYLALTSRWESGIFESPGMPSSLSSEASGGFEFLGRPTMNHIAAAAAAVMGEDIRGFRQSSIDSEPQTLHSVSVREAQDGAVQIIETYDQGEAVHLFLKDAEDEHLREQGLAAVLPTSELVYLRDAASDSQTGVSA